MAVKLPRIDGRTTDPRTRQLFVTEGATLACLTHPVLPTIHEVNVHDGTPYVVMEYVEGRTLEDRIAESPLTVDALIHVGIAAASALAEVHRHAHIHRDLHPRNILLEDDYRPRLIDFGYAAKLQTQPSGSTVIGSPHYCSPEQADERAELQRLHARAPVPDPRELRAELPDGPAGATRRGARLVDARGGRSPPALCLAAPPHRRVAQPPASTRAAAARRSARRVAARGW